MTTYTFDQAVAACRAGAKVADVAPLLGLTPLAFYKQIRKQHVAIRVCACGAPLPSPTYGHTRCRPCADLYDEERRAQKLADIKARRARCQDCKTRYTETPNGRYCRGCRDVRISQRDNRIRAQQQRRAAVIAADRTPVEVVAVFLGEWVVRRCETCGAPHAGWTAAPVLCPNVHRRRAA